MTQTCAIRKAELTTMSEYTNLCSILERLRLCFAQILACRVCACEAARQDEEKFRDRVREWRCIMKTTRSLELTLALLPSLLYARERVFCKLLRDTRISYFVQVPFSHLLFVELKKEGNFCSFHYDGRVVPSCRIVTVVVVVYNGLIIRRRFWSRINRMSIDETSWIANDS